ncbi:conserved hypothetical protein, secreted [Candidatus Magnetomorum sp. HK-1]|nr:conserved hypothetical protein, secreted [Candidatus Magnetomorum sp. HK-1]
MGSRQKLSKRSYLWIILFMMIITVIVPLIGKSSAIAQELTFNDSTTSSQFNGLAHANRLLLISSGIDNPMTEMDESILLREAASEDTIAVVYDTESTSLKQLQLFVEITMAKYAIKNFESIVFATHGHYDGFCLTQDGCVSQKSIENPLFTDFWSNISKYAKNRIDLLGCYLGQNENLLSQLARKTQRNISASTNITGSLEHNGDWFLEVGKVDLQKTYFNEQVVNQISTISLADGDVVSNYDVYENGSVATVCVIAEGAGMVFTPSGGATSGDGNWIIENAFGNYQNIKTNAVIDYETYEPLASGNKTYTIDVGGTAYQITLTIKNELEVADQSMGITESASNNDVVGVVYVSSYDIADYTPNFTITGGNTNSVFGLSNSSAGTIIP